MMTARKAGGLAALGVWVTLRRLRDQWMLLVFAASVLFWARDVYDSFVDLPARVAELDQEIGELRSDVGRIGAGEAAVTAGRSPAPLPGLGHAIGDGRPGDAVRLVSVPVERVRGVCRDSGPVAFVIAAEGERHPVETDPGRAPRIEGSGELAYGVTDHPGMAVGRAGLVVQVIRACGSHLPADSSPRLQLRVPSR